MESISMNQYGKRSQLDVPALLKDVKSSYSSNINKAIGTLYLSFLSRAGGIRTSEIFHICQKRPKQSQKPNSEFIGSYQRYIKLQIP